MTLTIKDFITGFCYFFLFSLCLSSIIILSYGVTINYGYAVSLGIFMLGVSSSLLIAFLVRERIKRMLNEHKFMVSISGLVFAVCCGIAIFHNLNLIMWKLGYPIDENINKDMLSSVYWWIGLTILLPLFNYSFFMEIPRHFLENKKIHSHL